MESYLVFLAKLTIFAPKFERTMCKSCSQNELLTLSDKAIALLKELIQIPSVSRDESAVADWLEKYMHLESGLPVGRVGNNCWLVAPGYCPSKPTLLLNAHCDTVKPSASWTYDPFKATEIEDRIYGLGANDDGASLVSLLHVFLHLKDTQQSYNLIFLASAEEEVSGKNGIELALTQLPKIEAAWVGEPTRMNVAVAEKGLVVLDGIAHGKSGHAARNEGVNALYIALEAIDKLRNFTFPQESSSLGPVKISVTNIQAGQGQHNVIPDLCTFIVDVRTTDAYTNEQVVSQLQELVGPDVELNPRSTRLQPSGISTEHPIIRRIEEMMPEVKCFGSPTLSDQALMSFPSLKMGPGESSRSHTANEYITKNEIRSAIEIYLHVLDGLQITEK